MARKVRASHILVKTEGEALELKYDVTHGKTFEEVAQLKSTCPSRKKGGDLGWFSRGQMVKEFEDVAFNAPIGNVSQPVKTRFGWHLIKVVELE